MKLLHRVHVSHSIAVECNNPFCSILSYLDDIQAFRTDFTNHIHT